MEEQTIHDIAIVLLAPSFLVPEKEIKSKISSITAHCRAIKYRNNRLIEMITRTIDAIESPRGYFFDWLRWEERCRYIEAVVLTWVNVALAWVFLAKVDKSADHTKHIHRLLRWKNG